MGSGDQPDPNDGPPKDDKFVDMTAAAAKEANKEPEQPGAAGAPPPNPVLNATIEQQYAKELHSNMEAHRQMRWVGFVVIGIVSFIFLMALLGVLTSMFSVDKLPAILASEQTGWHVWLVVGAALVIFAAIPLSLMMALVKMISEKSEEESGVKTPTVELGKVLYDLIKGFISHAKSGG